MHDVMAICLDRNGKQPTKESQPTAFLVSVHSFRLVSWFPDSGVTVYLPSCICAVPQG
jgi:hypothetical protein